MALRLYKPSSSSGKTSVKSVKVRGTSLKSPRGVKISPLKFKVPKPKSSSVKIKI